MAVEYIPLATSPDEEEARERTPSPAYHRRAPKWARKTLDPLAGVVHYAQQLTKTKILIFVLLFSLPVMYHLAFTSIRHLFDKAPQHAHENPYFHTGDIWQHNDEVAARLERCQSLGLLRNTSLPLEPLDPREEEELIAQGCGTNQTTITILASLWFAEAYSGTSTAGEAIYAQSVISTLNAYNYGYVFSSLGWYNPDTRKTVELWHKHRWNVRVVIPDPSQTNTCWNDAEQKCLKTEDNMEGIEAWRILTFWYWDDVANPLGEQWTLSPSPHNPNTLLSYSIEPTCKRLPTLAPEDRAHPPQAYLLAKQRSYFTGDKFAWTVPFLGELQSKLGIKVVAGTRDDNETVGPMFEEAGLTDFGLLPKIDFYEKISQSFVLVGVGKPRISPSPWDALCMGVPFINPIHEWDENDPLDRSKWLAQQWRMVDMEPPYVYSVKAHDLDGLERAVHAALNTPIESYIPPFMKFGQVCEYTAAVIEAPWHERGRDLLAQRLEEGEGALFVL